MTADVVTLSPSALSEAKGLRAGSAKGLTVNSAKGLRAGSAKE